MKFRLFAIIVMLCLLVNQASAQSAAKSKEYKDPKTATTWGYLLPGAGHIYAGESGKGWMLMTGSVGALGVGLGMTLTSGEDADIPDEFDPFGNPQNYGSADDIQDWTPAYVGLGVFSLGWLYSVVDAGKAAQRTNRKHGLSWLGPVRVVPYVVGKADRREYGVRLRFEL